MADIFDDDNLGSLLGDDDDLLKLLDSVQDKQNSGKDVLASTVSDDEGSPDSAVKMPGSSEDAYQKVLSDLNLEELAATLSAQSVPSVKTMDDYDKSIYGYPQLDEIEKGLKRGLDVSLYDSAELTFRQMREIRLGLEQKIDVSFYTSKYYKDTQMREIRLGLMQGLDVSSYARLIYSMPDMQRIHSELLKKKYEQSPEAIDITVTDLETEATICTVDGGMEAYIRLKKSFPDNFERKKLEVLLNLYGLTTGLVTEDKEFDPRTIKPGEDVLVASGEPSVMGEDGWYEYLVEDEESAPHMSEDGSIDYMAQRTYSYVQPGQAVAIYHPATNGKLGKNVFGMELPATSGKNLPRLSLEKIRILDDGVTYVSKKEGLASIKKGILNIVEQLEFKEDVGYGTNVAFEGDIYVRGSVLDSAILKAGGDIIIDGSVEAAIIKAGGDVVIRRGMNSDGKGELEAGGNVVAAFFENANVVAEGSVEADYILNSNIFCKKHVMTRGKRNLICGGRIVAGEGIQTSIMGGEFGTRTEVEVGSVNTMLENFSKLRKRRKELENEMDKVRDGMNQVLRKVGALNGRTNPIYLKLQDVLEQQKKEYAALQDLQDKMDDVIHKESNLYIVVTDTAYKNTRMTINGSSWLLDKDIQRSKFFARGRSVSFEEL
ncbi:MAG: DUF342 domain-containing protein [Lachnospiraceae bacterium]|nr:DUF342 domain-containing protein [Lachnospiraceae bacterium]